MWMDYCEDLAISYELLNFPRTFVLNGMLLRKIKRPLKKV